MQKEIAKLKWETPNLAALPVAKVTNKTKSPQPLEKLALSNESGKGVNGFAEQKCGGSMSENNLAIPNLSRCNDPAAAS